MSVKIINPVGGIDPRAALRFVDSAIRDAGIRKVGVTTLESAGVVVVERKNKTSITYNVMPIAGGG